jgi:hypothetical protein
MLTPSAHGKRQRRRILLTVHVFLCPSQLYQFVLHSNISGKEPSLFLLILLVTINVYLTYHSGDSVRDSVHSARVFLNFLPLGGLLKLPVLTPGEFFFIVNIFWVMT